jgi:hypothetical protein
MPAILMQLMRHESIGTTMRYYVGRSVEATTQVLWEAYRRDSTAQKADQEPSGENHQERDTSRDTEPKSPKTRMAKSRKT